MYEFLSIVLIVFGGLQIILFFKMWGMTNDIRDIKNKYLNSENQYFNTIETIKCIPTNNTKDKPKCYSDHKFQPGDHVVLKTTGKQMRIKEITNGKFSCYSQNGMIHDGDFDESEIKLFGF